jgi:DNA repair photolyase
MPKARSRAPAPPPQSPTSFAGSYIRAKPRRPESDPRLSRVLRSCGPLLGVHQLSPMWLGPLRMKAGQTARPTDRQSDRPQLELLPVRPTAALPVLLDRRERGTDFIELQVRSVLNTPATTRMGFWSINPYVGCEFGCTYCYARDTHKWVEERRGSEPAGQQESLPDWEAFERRILVKTGVAEVLARTLDPARLGRQSLVIGTATDCYQPAERRFRLTRQILEVLLHYRALSISIITKSPLVTRDIDLLQQLGRRHQVSVDISLATADPKLARRLELRSPVPAARLRALRRLTEGGVHAGLLIAPIVPGITDDREGLSRLIGLAKEAGAHYVSGAALRLGPAARRRFLPYLTRQFPQLAERYRRHYARNDNASPAYTRALSARLHQLRSAHGFADDDFMRRHPPPEITAEQEQPALL